MLWPSARRVGMRSLDMVLLWKKCIDRVHRYASNTDRTKVEVVPTPMIYMRDPFLRLKSKKGPTMDLDPKEGRKKRGASQTEEVDEKEETLLSWRERKAATL